MTKTQTTPTAEVKACMAITIKHNEIAMVMALLSITPHNVVYL
jgi:hypothetical protein